LEWLYYSGNDNPAGRLLSTLSGADLAGTDPNLAMDVGRILTVTGNEKTALKIANQLIGEADFDGARALSVGVFDTIGDDRSSFDRISKKLDRHLQTLISLGVACDIPPQDMSRVHYSRANLLFNRGQYREALREYRSAAVLDPEYRYQSYWWGESEPRCSSSVGSCSQQSSTAGQSNWRHHLHYHRCAGPTP
jgi:tetratricopeptide (TPR) repeat protein